MLFALFFFHQLVWAGGKRHIVSYTGWHITRFLRKMDNYDTSQGIQKNYIKLCSCQILELQINNRRQRDIALFAEKTNGHNLGSDLRKVNRVIEKEKIHMQNMFYDKLTVLRAFTESTDCRTLYLQLKRKNARLVLYDILDADIRR